MKTGSETVDAIMRGRRMVLFVVLVARMEDARLPNCVMFGRLVGGAGCVGGRKKRGRGIYWMTSEVLVLTLTSGRL